MRNERDELRRAERTKKRGLLSAVVGIAGVAVKASSEIQRGNEINRLKMEKNEIDRKFIKSRDDKAQRREIEERLNKLERKK